jgi:hypothetical protein
MQPSAVRTVLGFAVLRTSTGRGQPRTPEYF